MWRWGRAAMCLCRTQSTSRWATRCGGLGPRADTVSPAVLLACPIRNIVPLTIRAAFRELLPTKASFTRTRLHEPGTYSYHCIVHCVIGMTGVVNVSGGCVQSGWSAGPDMPTVLVRAVGVYFQPNGNFYTVGGRTSDTAGSDFQHPLQYNPTSNSWTQMASTFPTIR